MKLPEKYAPLSEEEMEYDDGCGKGHDITTYICLGLAFIGFVSATAFNIAKPSHLMSSVGVRGFARTDGTIATINEIEEVAGAEYASQVMFAQNCAIGTVASLSAAAVFTGLGVAGIGKKINDRF